MNINREDQNFEPLRRLLRLKRYEQPPPRYFSDFSSQVTARLQARGASAARQSWWQRVWDGLELRPAFPVVLSVAVCGLLVLGAVYSETAEVPEALLPHAAKQKIDSGKTWVESRVLVPFGELPSRELPGVMLAASSTNPPPPDSLFNLIPQPPAMRANHPMFR